MPEFGRLGAQLEIKAIHAKERVIEGHCSAYGNTDLGDDVVKAGAFSDWLTKNQPADALVFIGHDYKRLPVGVPTIIREDAHGLFCATKVFEGPSGDDLLAAAEGLAAAGKSLGLSIGYSIDPNGARWAKRDGQSVRELHKLSLREYSFTAIPMNPAAVVTGVKDEDGSDEDKAAVGSFDWIRQKLSSALREKNQRGCYIVELFSDRAIYRTYSDMDDTDQLYQVTYSIVGSDVTLSDPTPVDVQYVPMATKTDPPIPAPTAPSRSSNVKDLPDSAFLFVEDGDKDEQGRTTQSKRHFAYRNADGKIDAAGLTAALASIPSSTVIDAPTKHRMQTRTRLMLDATKTGTDPEAYDTSEWKQGAAIDLMGVAFQIQDNAHRIVAEHKAMALLGDDTKSGANLRPEMRAVISETAGEITRIVEWAELANRNEEEKAVTEWYRAQFDLMEVNR